MRIIHINEVDFLKLVRKVNILIPSQNAKMSPPVGPILGQVKVKIKDFCLQYNTYTQKYKMGLPLQVTVYVYKNETFQFLVKTPQTSFLLKNLMSYKKAKFLSLLDIYKVTLIKNLDDNLLPKNIIFRNILATVKQMKIEIK